MAKISKKRSFRRNKKAQNWATDVLVGAGIFLLGFVIFFYIINQKASTNNLSDLLAEVQKMSNSITTASADPNNPCSFIINNKIDKSKLEQCSLDYSQSKVLLGVTNDYCIYFVDTNGNLINISSITNNSGIGMGSTDINYTILDKDGNPTAVIPCTK